MPGERAVNSVRDIGGFCLEMEEADGGVGGGPI